jgi:carbon-monoxide dehydrogenase medium subunit
MYPAKFDYYRASSVSDAIAKLQQNPGAKLLAGGHSLLPAMKLRLSAPEMLVDIGRVSGIKGISSDGGAVRIGALTTHAEVANSSAVPHALSSAAARIGDPAVRNRGTVGGNVAHADPASDLPTVLVALGATVHIAGPNGERSVAADDFFVDLFDTDLAEDEVVTAIEIANKEGFTNRGNQTTSSAYAKLVNPASRYAMVGAAVSIMVDHDNNKIMEARVAVGGLTPSAQRAPAVEAALVGQKATAENIKSAAQAVASDLEDNVMGDIHASATYRRAMAPVMLERALTEALAQAG